MDVKPLLKRYYELSRPFQYDIDPDDPRFIKAMEMERQILKRFGLPHTFSFTEMLHTFGLKDECNEDDLEHLINYLKRTASSFLYSNPLTDQELLDSGYRHLADAADILPLMGLRGNVYQHFVWEEMWLKQRAGLKTVLDELKKADSITFEPLDEKTTGGVTILKATSTKHGLRWEDEWFLSDWAKINDRLKFDELNGLGYNRDITYPATIISKEIYLDRIIVYRSEDTVFLLAFVLWEDQFYPLQIYTDRAHFLRLLANAPNVSVSSLVRLHYLSVINGAPFISVDINLSKDQHTLLHCDICAILGCLSDEDDDADNEPVEPFVYYLHSLIKQNKDHDDEGII